MVSVIMRQNRKPAFDDHLFHIMLTIDVDLFGGNRGRIIVVLLGGVISLRALSSSPRSV